MFASEAWTKIQPPPFRIWIGPTKMPTPQLFSPPSPSIKQLLPKTSNSHVGYHVHFLPGHWHIFLDFFFDKIILMVTSLMKTQQWDHVNKEGY